MAVPEGHRGGEGKGRLRGKHDSLPNPIRPTEEEMRKTVGKPPEGS